jgi:hypothetical protein
MPDEFFLELGPNRVQIWAYPEREEYMKRTKYRAPGYMLYILQENSGGN